MKITKLIAVNIFAAMALFAVASPAGAVHIMGACADELNGLEDAINEANFLGRKADMDRMNMLTKLDAAAEKIDQEKFADAIDKLQDIADKASALATAPKPKLEDVTGIIAAVSAAKFCVGTLG